MFEILLHEHIESRFVISEILFRWLFYTIAVVYCIFVSQIIFVVDVIGLFSACWLIERLGPSEWSDFLEKLDLLTENLYIFFCDFGELVLIWIADGFDSFEDSLVLSIEKHQLIFQLPSISFKWGDLLALHGHYVFPHFYFLFIISAEKPAFDNLLTQIFIVRLELVNLLV